ncbi:hypothetical protein E2C01_049260 [Portunus trituberculatus]|uniref:Uncharacterized protein n=1 Tax=Portunus trituberculatus TaxID=210409 RepID=A0A5B7GCE4_PORTR|nr:hypothetical protein [Portunus trituberculatus]
MLATNTDSFSSTTPTVIVDIMGPRSALAAPVSTTRGHERPSTAPDTRTASAVALLQHFTQTDPGTTWLDSSPNSQPAFVSPHHHDVLQLRADITAMPPPSKVLAASLGGRTCSHILQRACPPLTAAVTAPMTTFATLPVEAT